MGVGVCFGATTVQGQLEVARCSVKEWRSLDWAPAVVLIYTDAHRVPT